MGAPVCGATTQKGKACKNRVASGHFCRKHAHSQREAAAGSTTCGNTTANASSPTCSHANTSTRSAAPSAPEPEELRSTAGSTPSSALKVYGRPVDTAQQLSLLPHHTMWPNETVPSLYGYGGSSLQPLSEFLRMQKRRGDDRIVRGYSNWTESSELHTNGEDECREGHHIDHVVELHHVAYALKSDRELGKRIEHPSQVRELCDIRRSAVNSAGCNLCEIPASIHHKKGGVCDTLLNSWKGGRADETTYSRYMSRNLQSLKDVGEATAERIACDFKRSYDVSAEALERVARAKEEKQNDFYHRFADQMNAQWRLFDAFWNGEQGSL